MSNDITKMNTLLKHISSIGSVYNDYAIPLASVIAELEARTPAAPVVAEGLRPTDDDLWDKTLRDRDTYHDWADKLAEAIAKYFGAEIGEHSNMNCPWAEALEVIEAAHPVAGSPAEESREERIGRRVLDFAKRGGWQDDGEGAFEFIQRHSYVVGYEDAGGKVDKFGTQTNGSRWPITAFTPTAAEPMPASEAASDDQLQKRVAFLETLVDAYAAKSLQYDIEHPSDGLNSADPKEVERVGRGTVAPVPASEAANASLLLETLEKANTQMIEKFADKRLNIEGYRDWCIEAMGAVRGAITILKRFAAPAAPTDAKDQREFNGDGLDGDELGYLDNAELVAKLERVSKWIDKFPVPTDGATAMMLLIREVQTDIAATATAAQSVRDAAQPAIAPGKEGA